MRKSTALPRRREEEIRESGVTQAVRYFAYHRPLCYGTYSSKNSPVKAFVFDKTGSI
uniref:VWFA domain-containing protein n=1 Tax=Heterorhabditis bacteriophora TaxID=37862 RepID=A0A1I7WL17_HETBA